MTQEEIIEYNKLCAEFLGFEISENKECFKLLNKNGWIALNIFHSDWNWIMEVLNKISFLDYGWKVTSKEVCIYSHRGDINQVNEPEKYTLFQDSKKEAVVRAIYKFLKWYKNENSN